MRGSVLLFLAVVLFFSCGGVSQDPDARATRLGQQIRCPVCRGVPIGASPSSLAQEMMQMVRQQIAAGKSDDEVLKYFEERYGEWALLEPKAEGLNLVVWILPALVVLGGGAGIVVGANRMKKKGDSA